MRRIFLTALVAMSLSGAFAQKAEKLEDVQEKISKGKYDEAKEKLDKIFADPKNASNPTAWYYKGKVYAALAIQDTTNKLTYDASGQAFEAFKKYQELEPKNTLMVLDQNIGLFQLYDLHYNRGVRAYNNKDYTVAYDQMKKALAVESYIAKKGYTYNGFSFPTTDTTLINLTASSAYLAKKEEEAIPYFEQLADLRLSDKEYKEIYSLLVDYHMKKNNQQKMDKYLTLGRQLHKDDDFWTAVEFGNITDKAQKMARYEQLTQKYPDNYNLWFDYGVELFNDTYGNETKPADYTARQERTGRVLARAAQLQPTAMANFVMAQHLYNQVFDLDDQLRAVKGTDVTANNKRKEIRAKIDAKYEEMHPYSMKAYEAFSKETATMKPQDKANYRKSIDQLIDYHTRKKQMDKVASYEAKKKEIKL